jgi:hypothetical protein
MKHFLITVAIATLAGPVYAQAGPCAMFQSAVEQARCLNELTQAPPAQPYCLPMTAQEMRAVRAGQRVAVPGVGGCQQVWN